MSRSHPAVVLLSYTLVGPLIGTVLVSIGYVLLMGASAELEAVAQGMFIGIVFGYPLGISPALATGIVHLIAVRYRLARLQLLGVVCGSGLVLSLLFIQWVHAGRGVSPFALAAGAAAALSAYIIALFLLRDRPSAT